MDYVYYSYIISTCPRAADRERDVGAGTGARGSGPRWLARQKIDALPEQTGWIVQDLADMNFAAGRGIAVREFSLPAGTAQSTTSSSSPAGPAGSWKPSPSCTASSGSRSRPASTPVASPLISTPPFAPCPSSTSPRARRRERFSLRGGTECSDRGLPWRPGLEARVGISPGGRHSRGSSSQAPSQ